MEDVHCVREFSYNCCWSMKDEVLGRKTGCDVVEEEVVEMGWRKATEAASLPMGTPNHGSRA